MYYAVRASYQVGDDDHKYIEWFIVTVPDDCDDIKGFIRSYLKDNFFIEYGAVTYYRFVDGCYLQGGE